MPKSILPLLSHYFCVHEQHYSDAHDAQLAVRKAIDATINGLTDELSEAQLMLLRQLLAIVSDELMLNASVPYANQWLDAPLSQQTHGGEWFFTQLEQCLREPALNSELLLICHCLLAYGFKGKYIRQPSNQLRYVQRKLRENIVPETFITSVTNNTRQPQTVPSLWWAGIMILLTLCCCAWLSWRHQLDLQRVYQQAGERLHA